MNHFNTPLKSSTQSEDTHQLSQFKSVFQYLEVHVATASMVSKATNVPHKNFCRFKRELQLAGRLWELRKDICELTGFKAWYLTTNPRVKPNNFNQLSLFNDLEGGNND